MNFSSSGSFVLGSPPIVHLVGNPGHLSLDALEEVKDGDLVDICTDADDDTVLVEARSRESELSAGVILQVEMLGDCSIAHATVAQAVASRPGLQSFDCHLAPSFLEEREALSSTCVNST